jgi:uncharacterized protein (TIGR00251 family)
MTEAAVRILENAVRFSVRLTPKGGRDALEGWIAAADGNLHLKARVSAPPEGGKANKALIALLSKQLDAPKSAIRIVSGETARLKVVEIAGNTGALKPRLQALDRIG